MLQKRINPIVLFNPKSELEIAIRDYYILYNVIILGLVITLVRINLLISIGRYILPLYGYILILLICYIALRYIISLFYLNYKIRGIFYIMSYKKVKELVKRIEELEEMQDHKE
jgi:hypothetical protein